MQVGFAEPVDSVEDARICQSPDSTAELALSSPLTLSANKQRKLGLRVQALVMVISPEAASPQV